MPCGEMWRSELFEAKQRLAGRERRAARQRERSQLRLSPLIGFIGSLLALRFTESNRDVNTLTISSGGVYFYFWPRNRADSVPIDVRVSPYLFLLHAT